MAGDNWGNHAQGGKESTCTEHAVDTVSAVSLLRDRRAPAHCPDTGMGKTNNSGSLRAETAVLVTISRVFRINRNIQEISRKPLVSNTTGQPEDRQETDMFLL